MWAEGIGFTISLPVLEPVWNRTLRIFLGFFVRQKRSTSTYWLHCAWMRLVYFIENKATILVCSDFANKSGRKRERERERERERVKNERGKSEREKSEREWRARERRVREREEWEREKERERERRVREKERKKEREREREVREREVRERRVREREKSEREREREREKERERERENGETKNEKQANTYSGLDWFAFHFSLFFNVFEHFEATPLSLWKAKLLTDVPVAFLWFFFLACFERTCCFSAGAFTFFSLSPDGESFYFLMG